MMLKVLNTINEMKFNCLYYYVSNSTVDLIGYFKNNKALPFFVFFVTVLAKIPTQFNVLIIFLLP